MNNYSDYFAWLADGGWIRVSARAIILNHSEDQILVERNFGAENNFMNFIGGGVEVGETLEECIQRELNEETNTRIVGAKYLFVLEHFIPYKSEIRHSLEHYFEISLQDEKLMPKSKNVEFLWIPLDKLADIDLRPAIVRNHIMNGTFRNMNHLVFK